MVLLLPERALVKQLLLRWHMLYQEHGAILKVRTDAGEAEEPVGAGERERRGTRSSSSSSSSSSRGVYVTGVRFRLQLA